MAIGTGLGWSNWPTVALSVLLAFVFGYLLTLLPLFRAGIATGAALGLAFASDTASIAIMEIVDNAIMLAIPGAMDAGLASPLFWGSLIVSLIIAGWLRFPSIAGSSRAAAVMRWYISIMVVMPHTSEPRYPDQEKKCTTSNKHRKPQR